MAARAKKIEEAQTGVRKVWFEGRRMETPIYNRETLPLSVNLRGPAILEQRDTTVVLEPEDDMFADDFGNIIININMEITK